LHAEDATGKDKKSDLEEFEKAFAQALPGQPSPTIAFRPVCQEEFGFAIVDFATDRNAGLIVMGAHTASFAATHLLRGIVPQVVAEAPCPVMVLQTQ
jgi:nucleotide-binding universal stress UspA family protein